ncbi:MAG TPA: hypothetical protein VEU74_10450 [Gemmatimonadales bacterium]|nr:hypothetical protein [Gemmatimonadales bacterium]
MSAKRALWAILIVSLCGVAFSGFLTYRELFQGAAGCSAVAPGTILGYPPCIYGFFMYLVVATLAVGGLDAERRRSLTP